MAERRLTWRGVSAWRLAQQGLEPRLARHTFLDAATRTGGIQAQVMSAAEQSLAARAEGIAAQDVRAALWGERTLLKTWAMRGTLHLIATRDLPLLVAARSLTETRNWRGYFAYYGFTDSQYAAYLEAAPEILRGGPLTREQFADAVAAQLGAPDLRRLVLSMSWGTPLKPLAWRGELCFGPSQGQSVTFTSPATWAGAWQPLDPHEAMREVGRRYLRAYGPSTPEDFVRWWDGGSGLIAARRLFRSLADEIEPVDVEGWRALALRETIEPIARVEPTGAVRLLPLFDAYVLGLGRGPDIAALLAPEQQQRVFRPQGWISAVVLVDGAIRGVWELASQRARPTITVQLFGAADARMQRGIAAEVERLSAFTQRDLALAYAKLSGRPASAARDEPPMEG